MRVSVLDILKANTTDLDQFVNSSHGIICILGQYENKALLKSLLSIEQKSSIEDSFEIKRFAFGQNIFQIISMTENVNLKTSVLSNVSRVSNFELEFQKNIFLANQIQKQQYIFKSTEEYQLKICDFFIFITNDYQIESKLKIENLMLNNKFSKNHLILHDLVFFEEEYKKTYQNILKQSKNLSKLSNSKLDIWRENHKQKNIDHIFIFDQQGYKGKQISFIKEVIHLKDQNYQKSAQEELKQASEKFLKGIQPAKQENTEFYYYEKSDQQDKKRWNKMLNYLKIYCIIFVSITKSYQNADIASNYKAIQLQIFQTFEFKDVDNISPKYPNKAHYESLFVGLIGEKHYGISKLLTYFSISMNIQSHLQIDIYKSQQFSLIVKVPELPFHKESLEKKILKIQDEVIAQNSDILILYLTNFNLEQLKFIYDFCRYENLKYIIIIHDLSNLMEEQVNIYKYKLVQKYNLKYNQLKKEFYFYRQQKDYCYNQNLKQIQHFILKKDNKIYEEEFRDYLKKLIQLAVNDYFYNKRSTKQIEKDLVNIQST
ncbi:hypothetical protein ABPG72_014540 [Tetrahymena utriculariae]